MKGEIEEERMSQSSLTELLQLESEPVAITFVETPPTGVPRVSSAEAAGCGYWRRAAAGEVFFTVADDHKRCPVGAHTHNVPLSASEESELMGLVKTMVGLSYLKMEDVPQIPRRKAPLQAAVYAPLALAPMPPDVVLVRGNARQLMLLTEAANSAGVAGVGPAMGRPTCAVLPEAINATRTAVSFGCVGNRVYTGASDAEAYFAIPGQHLETLQNSLMTIVRANEELEKFHQARAAVLAV
jgi:uncharacterized protein (DUF169 family)